MPRERLLIGSDVGCYLGLAAVYAATQHRDGSRDNYKGCCGSFPDPSWKRLVVAGHLDDPDAQIPQPASSNSARSLTCSGPK